MLADIPTIRLDFVAWLCARLGLSCQTVACTRERPLPAFPSADVVVATEIFEHLHDPLPALARLDRSLRPGGFLVTNVDDHDEEFMHVSPKLGRLRARLTQLGYAEFGRHVLFRKAAATASDAAAGRCKREGGGLGGSIPTARRLTASASGGDRDDAARVRFSSEEGPGLGDRYED